MYITIPFARIKIAIVIDSEIGARIVVVVFSMLLYLHVHKKCSSPLRLFTQEEAFCFF